MVGNSNALAIENQFTKVYINLLSIDCFFMFTRNEKENSQKILEIVYLTGLILGKISYQILSKNINKTQKYIVRRKKKLI